MGKVAWEGGAVPSPSFLRLRPRACPLTPPAPSSPPRTHLLNASHEDFWPRADEWLPERWLPENAAGLAPHASTAFMPFSVGPRRWGRKGAAWRGGWERGPSRRGV
jgi:hypothetical protein